MGTLTLGKLKCLLDMLRAKAQKPRIIQTQKEANRINKMESRFGLKRKWRVGDTYYLLSDLTHGS